MIFPFVFQDIYWFWIGLLLLIGYGGWVYTQYQKPKTILTSVFSDLQIFRKKSWKRYLPIIRHILFVVVLFFLVIALARPQMLHNTERVKKTGVDIFIVLDISESMLAEDLTPNRIEAAKGYIREFIQQLQTDRVGVIVFAGKPFTHAPLTFDYGVVDAYVRDISTQSINQRVRGLNGTAVGDALLLGLDRLKDTEARTRVMVLLTDGDANVGIEPLIAAQKASSEGVKVYAIGIGDEEGALIPIATQNGEKVYARNQDGSFVRTSLNKDALKNVAEKTGGSFFHVQTNQALRESFEMIQSLEKTEIESEISIQYEEKFQVFLWMGIVFLVFYIGFVFFIPLYE